MSDKDTAAPRQLGVVADRIEHRQELMLHSQQIVTLTEFMEAYDG